ncbi:hypothetical protein [Celeribacter persicus]|uniref:Pentapeptide repeat protein n=1 Tax=Celeribacter persicus TaxID=1651082 RepID=A0A2T5HS85_9RHOB|nr:hypothetical protein [Celeribacter persicus]PTQ74445.1 hypothetical protein C8N42_10489 [Celeribacter persicus]
MRLASNDGMISEFSPDCSNCAALCCLALAFDAGEMFGHDKAAGVPCHQLNGFSCSIHAQLASRGYGGCVAFDCLGAGQRVTALFEKTWREQPKLTGPMMEAFRQMREVQNLRQMLATASALPLPETAEAERQNWQSHLSEVAENLTRLASFDPKPVRNWLRGLATHISR